MLSHRDIRPMITLIFPAIFQYLSINHWDPGGKSPSHFNHPMDAITTRLLSLAHAISQRGVFQLKAFQLPSLVFKLILSGAERVSWCISTESRPPSHRAALWYLELPKSVRWSRVRSPTETINSTTMLKVLQSPPKYRMHYHYVQSLTVLSICNAPW